MNELNLQPKPPWTKEEAQIQGQKGGLVKSEKKTRAAKINAYMRSLKKKGLTDENAERAWHVIMDADISHAEIYMYIKSIQAIANTASEKAIAARLLLEWDKTHHKQGPDTQVNILNNVNVPKQYEFIIKHEYDVKAKEVHHIERNDADNMDSE